MSYRNDMICPHDRGGCGSWWNITLKEPLPGTGAGDDEQYRGRGRPTVGDPYSLS